MTAHLRSRTSKNRLKNFLDGRNLSLAQFCTDTGIHTDTASRMYEDERILPDMTMPEAIWKAYQEGSVSSLVVYDPEDPSLAAGERLFPPSGAPLQITICGCGNLGHVFAGLLSARRDLRVNICVSTQGKALQLEQALSRRGGITVHFPDGERVTGRPNLVTADPARAIPGSRLVLMCVPSMVEEAVLTRILPFLDEDTFVGSIPAPGGFDWKARRILQQRKNAPVVFGMGVIPWMCKIKTCGEEVAVLGKKTVNGVVVIPPNRTAEVADLMSNLLTMPVLNLETFLNLTLSPGNQLLHPGIMYSLFHAWDGTPFDRVPFFYEDVTEEATALLQQMSDELMLLRHALESQIPNLRLPLVLPLNLSILYGHGASVKDPSSLHSIIATNRAYAGIKTPMRQVEGGWVPDFGSRFFWEDIPHGLVVTHGLAELAGVSLPTIDRVLVWAQEQMGCEYLVDGKLQGKDLPNSGAPQRYGFHSLRDLAAGAV